MPCSTTKPTSLTPYTHTDTIAPEELTSLFSLNQSNFYRVIAFYAASSEADAVLRFFTVDGVDVIVSPGMHWAFYNTILSTDFASVVHENNAASSAPELTLAHITRVAKQYHVPLRCAVRPDATESQRVLRSQHWLKMVARKDGFQYFDFTTEQGKQANYDAYSYLTDPAKHGDIKLVEIDDTTGEVIDLKTQQRTAADTTDLKYQWGTVLVKSFQFKSPEQHAVFYSTVWSQVIVGPAEPVRMFVALRGNTVIGGSHLSVDHPNPKMGVKQSTGVAVLFNVTALPGERGVGLGKALSIAAVAAAKQMKYKYMLLQASPAGAPVYKRIGFQPLPGGDTWLKLSTADWWCGALEFLLYNIGVQHLFAALGYVEKLKQKRKLIAAALVGFVALIVTLILLLGGTSSSGEVLQLDVQVKK